MGTGFWKRQRRGIGAIIVVNLSLVGFGTAQDFLNESMPMHGNWCGPGHPENVWVAASPIDPLDAACMRHDYCVTSQGLFSCGCDISLMQELAQTRWPNEAYNSKARAIYDAISMLPCSDPNGTAFKQSMFMQSIWSDMASGSGGPQDVLIRLGFLGMHVMERKFWSGTLR